MNSLVIGATAGLGRALSEQLAAKGHNLYLLASDTRDLDSMAADLRIRHEVEVIIEAIDLRDMNVTKLRDNVLEGFAELDNLFLVAGMYSDDDNGPLGESRTSDLIGVNFLSPIKLVDGFLGDIRDSLVGIGSIAEIRPRGQSMVYGASKRGLCFYFEALRHRYQKDGPCIQYYRAGYMDTAMTFGKKLPLPAARPTTVAKTIVRRLGKKSGMSYVPWWWRPVSWAYSMIPWTIFKQMNG